jgi:transcriptional regulator with XRE-family HTH domain
VYDIEGGNRLRLLRVLSGYSQEQASYSIRLPLGTYSQHENKGRQSRDKYIYDKLAGTLNTPRNVIEGKGLITGPAFYWPRQYELRQASLVRDLIRDVLPTLIKFETCKNVSLSGKGSLYIVNGNVVFVVPEDLESVFSKIIPQGLTEDAEYQLPIGPPDIKPYHIDTLVDKGDLTRADAEPIARRLAVLISGDEEIATDWIEPLKTALALEKRAELRHSIAESYIKGLYPKISDEKWRDWLINYITGPAQGYRG